MARARRPAAEYIGPTTLRLPATPIKLVYLDLNHWISLAKAQAGHPDGAQRRDALAACSNAFNRHSTVFPISDTIYFETSKIQRYRQRRDLREVIEQVSRFIVITSRSVISTHEIESLVDHLVGPNPKPVYTMSYVDWGVARAFGAAGGFRVQSSDGADVTGEVRERHPDGPEAFDQALADAELELDRKVLEGPTAEEEPELRSLGWDPLGAFSIMERRALVPTLRPGDPQSS